MSVATEALVALFSVPSGIDRPGRVAVDSVERAPDSPVPDHSAAFFLNVASEVHSYSSTEFAGGFSR